VTGRRRRRLIVGVVVAFMAAATLAACQPSVESPGGLLVTSRGSLIRLDELADVHAVTSSERREYGESTANSSGSQLRASAAMRVNSALSGRVSSSTTVKWFAPAIDRYSVATPALAQRAAIARLCR